jgi:hypothetical protein
MGFWFGITIGLFLGANVGVFVAGLLAGCNRQKSDSDYPWDQLHLDQAVMEEAAPRKLPDARPLPSASADPLAHS